MLFSQSLHAQEIDDKRKIIAQYDSLTKFLPKEKLYVHFDKAIYTTQDTIWFKAYLFDESLKSAAQLSGLIYVEMIDYKGDVVKSMSLPTTAGLTWGGLPINTNYQPGNYTFRAYTNWMQNFGETYFFKKELKIVALQAEQVISKDRYNALMVTKKVPQSYLKGRQKFDVQFLPEGGSWVAGLTQKMAFKAIKANGKGVEIAGEVVDSKKNVVVQFKSNQKGMGYFNLNPKLNEEYTVVFKKPTEIKDQTLPKAQANGITLQVTNDFLSDSLSITINNTLPNQTHYLLGQSRGGLCFVTTIKANTTVKTIKVGKDIFPSGLSQIILLDANKQPVNERSFFINHKDQLKISMATPQTTYSTRDSIPIQLKVADVIGKPVVGSFSMAITDDEQVAKDTLNDSNILTYLLLSSNLKGEIENPGQYFNQANEENHKALEALVLTQGWTSYYNHPIQPTTFKAEKEFTISGKITNILNKPIAKANISLFGRNKELMFLQAVTDDKGQFVFNNLPAMDSASFVIQALNAKDKKGTLGIEVDEFKRPVISLIPQINTVDSVEVVDTTVNNLIKNQQQAYVITNGGQMLKEISVVGKKVIRKSKNLNGPGNADLTLGEADLNKVAKKTLYQVIEEQVRGFRAGTMKKTPEQAFFVNNSIVKLVIDGTDVDFFYHPVLLYSNNEHLMFLKGYLDYYDAEDIAGIEVMYTSRNVGPYRAQFVNPMSNTDYCFIEITTKSGSGPFLKKAANMYLYKPMDYGDLKVFYSPKYTSATKSIKGTDFRSTLYWAPNLITNEKGETQTSFFSSDKKGTYTIWLEGTDMLGNFGVKTLKLQIK
ncbi:hypothetical protein AQF98_05690 [Pedobacter sp. Hv1]|nr:hypothetical protein AQF98_05690 [Pedobacter sp. Hv1]